METPDWHDAALELVAELREINEALAVNELSAREVAEAAKLARGIREHLAGSPRRRWYDATGENPATGASARLAYLEQSPIRGRLNAVAPPLALETLNLPDGSRRVGARCELGSRYEGPPHGVHGGWVAALFDEVLGSAAGLAEQPGVTATLKVRYRHVTPTHEELRFEGWIHEQRGRRLVVRATCHAGETLTADAEGIFIEVDFDEVQERMMQRRLAREPPPDDN
jgi:acyl-coenzyme A thioesterase PaaI-like protein